MADENRLLAALNSFNDSIVKWNAIIFGYVSLGFGITIILYLLFSFPKSNFDALPYKAFVVVSIILILSGLVSVLIQGIMMYRISEARLKVITNVTEKIITAAQQQGNQVSIDGIVNAILKVWGQN